MQRPNAISNTPNILFIISIFPFNKPCLALPSFLMDPPIQGFASMGIFTAIPMPGRGSLSDSFPWLPFPGMEIMRGVLLFDKTAF